MVYKELYVVGPYYPAAFHTITDVVESVEGVKVKRMVFEVLGSRYCGSLIIESVQLKSIRRVVERLGRLSKTSVSRRKHSLGDELSRRYG